MEEEGRKHKPSAFFADKKNKEQRLEIADEIDVCDGLLDVKNITISCSKGCTSASLLGSMMSSIRMFPEISKRFHQGLSEVVLKYRDELKEAKIQIENEHLAKK